MYRCASEIRFSSKPPSWRSPHFSARGGSDLQFGEKGSTWGAQRSGQRDQVCLRAQRRAPWAALPGVL